MTAAPFSWPLITLDFEASSLEEGGYPVEVGLALWPAPDAPVQGWSCLIRPAPDWRSSGHWSRRSQAVHGLTRRDLEAGADPGPVMHQLNTLAGGRVLWCDGGSYDAYWLRRLGQAADIAPDFTLGDWSWLTRGTGGVPREAVLAHLDAAPPQHRARADAERLLLALAHGLGAAPSLIELTLDSANRDPLSAEDGGAP